MEKLKPHQPLRWEEEEKRETKVVSAQDGGECTFSGANSTQVYEKCSPESSHSFQNKILFNKSYPVPTTYGYMSLFQTHHILFS